MLVISEGATVPVTRDTTEAAPAPVVALDGEPAGTSRGGSQSIAAVERALDVLLLLGREGRPDLGVTEISTRLGLSKAAVHRILTSLRTRDLVTLDLTTRRYALGPGALGLGRAYLARIDVRAMAAPELAALCAATDETATLSVRNGDSRVYVEQVVPDREVRVEVAVGVPYPLHAGASSKAFLAFLSDEEVDSYVARTRLQAVTDATITDDAALRAELETIRERCYATSAGERMAGATSVAAPVLDQGGRPVAVLSVSGPSERFAPAVDDAVGPLLAATARLSARLGWDGGRSAGVDGEVG